MRRVLYPEFAAVDKCCEAPIIGLLPPWWNWHTQQVEGLCPYGRAGSSPVGGTERARSNAPGSFFVWAAMRVCRPCKRLGLALFLGLDATGLRLGLATSPWPRSTTRLGPRLQDCRPFVGVANDGSSVIPSTSLYRSLRTDLRRERQDGRGLHLARMADAHAGPSRTWSNASGIGSHQQKAWIWRFSRCAAPAPPRRSCCRCRRAR